MTNSRIWYIVAFLLSLITLLGAISTLDILHYTKEIGLISLQTIPLILSATMMTVTVIQLLRNDEENVLISYEVTGEHSDKNGAHVHIVLDPFLFPIEPQTSNHKKIIEKIASITEKELDEVSVGDMSMFSKPNSSTFAFTGTIPANTKIDVAGETKIKRKDNKWVKIVETSITPEGGYPRIRAVYTTIAPEIIVNEGDMIQVIETT